MRRTLVPGSLLATVLGLPIGFHLDKVKQLPQTIEPYHWFEDSRPSQSYRFFVQEEGVAI